MLICDSKQFTKEEINAIKQTLEEKIKSQKIGKNISLGTMGLNSFFIIADLVMVANKTRSLTEVMGDIMIQLMIMQSAFISQLNSKWKIKSTENTLKDIVRSEEDSYVSFILDDSDLKNAKEKLEKAQKKKKYNKKYQQFC